MTNAEMATYAFDQIDRARALDVATSVRKVHAVLRRARVQTRTLAEVG